MRSISILVILALGFLGWSILQAKESIEVIKHELEKIDAEKEFLYQIDHVAIANASKLGVSL